jgi:hypothetical protein
MIQRIQTVYLAIISILTLVLVFSGFIYLTGENGSVIKLTVLGVVSYTGQNSKGILQANYLNIVIAAIVLILSVISIYLYKKRMVQLIIVKALIFAELMFVGSIILSSLNVFQDYPSNFKPGIAAIIPLIQIILAMLAHRGIKKDDELVKSYDRLR